MGETLKRRIGFMPVWAWGLVFVVLLGAYLSYRKNKAAAAQNAQTSNNLSSNLGTVPVSNLTTAAMPMPIQMGDVFVNTSVSPPTTANNRVPTPNPILRWWPLRRRTPSWKIQTPPLPAPSPVVAPIALNTPSPTPPTPTAAPAPQTMPGYGAGLGQLLANNPTLLSANTPGGVPVAGITGYQVSYNGVPL